MGGSSIGHVIPGVALYGWAWFLLVMTLLVHRNVWSLSTALKLGALIQLVGSSIAVGQELIGGFSIHDPFHNKDHLTLHSSYFFSGLTFLLEARGRLPRESWRLAQSYVNFSIALLLYVHSTMQAMEEHHPIEGFTHWLLSIATFATSFAHFAGWAVQSFRLSGLYIGVAFLMLQGIWLLFQSYILYSGDFGEMGGLMEMADVTSYFIWFLLISTISCVLFEIRFGISPNYAGMLPELANDGKSYNKVADTAEVEAMLQ